MERFKKRSRSCEENIILIQTQKSNLSAWTKIFKKAGQIKNWIRADLKVGQSSLMIKNRDTLKFSAVFVLILLTFSKVTESADRVFKCKSDMATGFFLDNGDWKESSFELSDFVLTFDDDFKKMTISGEGSLGFTCRPHYL